MMNDKFSDATPAEKSRCIEEVAELYGVNPWTIRMWVDRFEMLEHIVDGNGGMLFTPQAVERIGMICRLAKKEGMTFEDVRKHLRSGDHPN